MKTELQLPLSSFNAATGPVCGGKPDSNGFRLLCYHCPFSVRRRGSLFCGKYRRFIGSRTKYGLPAWKDLRRSILERDRHSCIICRSSQCLCVHHRDRDPTNDDPENLVTLCDVCHALVHMSARWERTSISSLDSSDRQN